MLINYITFQDGTLRSSSPDLVEEQLWLPFMETVKVTTHYNPVKPSPTAQVSVRRRAKRPSVHIDVRPIYEYHLGVHQHVLPFREFQAIWPADWKRLILADWPAFERDCHGRVFQFPFTVPVDDLKAWCSQHCTGRFYISSKQKAYFQTERDALFARLVA